MGARTHGIIYGGRLYETRNNANAHVSGVDHETRRHYSNSKNEYERTKKKTVYFKPEIAIKIRRLLISVPERLGE